MKIKSLAMKIWLSFTAIILVIILGIVMFSNINYGVIDRNNKTNDLLTIHNVLIGQGRAQEANVIFDKFQNLRGSEHFILIDGQILRIGRAIAIKDEPMLIKQGSIQIEQWISSFAKDNMQEEKFYNKYNGTNYIFIISSIDGGYFISYMPIINNNQLIKNLLIVGAIFVLIGFFVAKFVAKSITKPIRELEEFTQRVAEKNFNVPITVECEDEIGRLADSMNEMQARLKSADEEEKQFLQSISHGLKTPVMVIMAHADAIVDGVYVNSLENTANIIKDEAVELNKKIKQLLYFNTLDYVLINQAVPTLIDLSNLLLQTIERFRILGNTLEWEVAVDDNVKITADEENVIVALENLLDNAIRYAKSKITINLSDEKGAINISIKNDGESIEEDRIERIFDNMYKGKDGNFGLGLAITKKVITHYGGSICAVNVIDDVDFIITFPKDA